MSKYYVIKNKETGLYFRGKGANRWGKHFNQASIYRVRGTAEHSIKEIAWHGEQAEIVEIQIVEAPTITYEDLVPHGRWETECEPHYTCSACKHWFNLYGPTNFCPNCGAKMDGGNDA